MPNDIELTIGIRNEELKRDLAESQKMLRNTFSEYTAKSIIQTRDKINTLNNALGNIKKVNLGKGLLPSNFDKGFTDINSEIKQLSSVNIVTAKKSMTGYAKEATAKLTTITESAKRMRGQLLMGSLSMLFFGQTLQRIFNSVWNTGTKTFNDIMHSVQGTTTGFDILTGSMTYLGFTLGQALEPIAVLLAPIILQFADWVTQNQEIVGTVLVIVGVLGTLLFVLGTIGSALTGLVSIVGLFTGTTVTIGAIGTAIGTVLLPLLAAVGLAIILWNTNLGGFRDFVTNTFSSIWNTIKSIFGNIVSLVKDLFSGNLVGVFQNLIAIILKLFIQVGANIVNVFIWVINTIKDFFFGMIEWFLNSVKSIASLIDKLLGTNFASQVQSAITTIDKLKTKLSISYISADSINSAVAGVDSLLGTKTSTSNTTVNNNQVITNNVTVNNPNSDFLSSLNKKVS